MILFRTVLEAALFLCVSASALNLPENALQPNGSLTSETPSTIEKAKITVSKVDDLTEAAAEVIKALPTSEVAAGRVVNALSPNSRGTLDNLLNFLKVSGSPVAGLMELRSLLLAQKEEKIVLRSLVDQMRVDLQGIRRVSG